MSFRSACVSLFVASLLAMVAFISWQESMAAVQDSYRNHQKRSLDKEVTTTQVPMTAKIHEDNKKSKSNHTKKSTEKNENNKKLKFKDSKTSSDAIQQKMAAKHEELIQEKVDLLTIHKTDHVQQDRKKRVKGHN